MNDWLNPEPTAPAAQEVDGGYLGPSNDELLYDIGEPAPLDPDPFASPTQSAPAPAYVDQPAAPVGSFSVTAPMLDDVQRTTVLGGQREDLSELVLDVEVPVEVMFGNAALTVEEFLEIGPGSVVELDRAISEPIQLRVRGKHIANGQLVSINGNYGLRITDTVEEIR
jgi:flagellar motor switch protein FliN/FliY